MGAICVYINIVAFVFFIALCLVYLDILKSKYSGPVKNVNLWQIVTWGLCTLISLSFACCYPLLDRFGPVKVE